MRRYKGIVKGKTIVLEERPNLPDDSPALVTITPLNRVREGEIVSKQLELLKSAPDVGKLLYERREELHER